MTDQAAQTNNGAELVCCSDYVLRNTPVREGVECGHVHAPLRPFRKAFETDSKNARERSLCVK